MKRDSRRAMSSTPARRGGACFTATPCRYSVTPLDPAMHLEAWDATASIRYDQQLWNELASLRFLDGHHGALILGPVGVGKTHLATALGHIAVRRRRTVHMARADQVFKRLKAARLDNSTDTEMRRLAAVELLILDDFALHPLDATATADFYELTVHPAPQERHHRHLKPRPQRMARPDDRPATSPVRRRPAHLHLPRAHRRRRVLPPPPAPPPAPNLTNPAQLPHDAHRARPRWSLGHGNTLVPCCWRMTMTRGEHPVATVTARVIVVVAD